MEETVIFSNRTKTFEVPVIPNAEMKYRMIGKLSCKCKEDELDEYKNWHMDGIHKLKNGSVMYICVTCQNCRFKFMTALNIDNLFYFLNKQGDEFVKKD